MAQALTMPRQISLWGWLRVSFRLLAMVALLISCVGLFYLWRLAGKLTGLHNPWPRIFLSGIGGIAGVRLRVVGGKVTRGAVLIANHVSWIDIPALAASAGAVFVAHDGLAIVPVLRWLCRMNDTIFIARHDRASVAEQVEQVRQAIRSNGALTIFPEGTTSDGTGLLGFKSSLLSAIEPVPEGIAIQPVVLDYGREAAQIAWVGDEHGLDNFLRILARRRPVELTVRFLEPLTGAELTNRKTMATAAREAMLEALGG